MTREAAFDLLQEHNKDAFHIEHGETVEATMRYFAREFDPENQEFWGIVVFCTISTGKSMTTNPRCTRYMPRRSSKLPGGRPSSFARFRATRSDFNPDLPKPELQMEKILFATEELTGLIGAAVIMRPSKSVMDFEVKIAEEEVQGQALCCRRESRCDSFGRRDARLGAGRAVRPHHQGHAEFCARSRYL